MSNSERILTNNQIIKDNNDDLAIILDKINRIPPAIDTSDATAKAEDILKDKTAYVKGEKITGTYEGGEVKPVFTGHYDKEGLMTKLGWAEEDVDYYQQNGVTWNKENDFLFEVDQQDVDDKNTTNVRFVEKGSTTTKFSNYSKLIAIPNLNFSAVTSMNNAFFGCSALRTIPLLNTSNVTSMFSAFNNCYSLKTIPLLNTSKVTTMNTMFTNCYVLEEIPLLDTSLVTEMTSMFMGCYNLKKIPLLNTNKVTLMSSMFNNCYSLKTIPLLNTSKVTSMTSMFTNCYVLEEIPLLDTSKATSMNSMFSNCRNLVKIPQINTSSAKACNNFFNGCYLLTLIPTLDYSNVTNVSGMCNNCHSLKYLGGFKNLGQAYSTTSTENYSYYKLDLSSSPLLTHDSLMNVINNLYDIKTKGCKNQALVLGATNLAKLTAEEVAIATNKGWNVS